MEDSLRIVDSDLVIDFLRDHAPSVGLMEAWLMRDLVRFSAVPAFELRFGTDFTKRADKIGRLLTARTLPLDHAAALIAAEVWCGCADSDSTSA